MANWKFNGFSSKEEYERNRQVTILKYCKFMTYEDAMQPVDSDRSKFCGALAYAFDIDCAIVGDLANRGYLNVPEIKNDFPKINQIQYLTCLRQVYCNAPIFQLLWFLFYDEDPDLGEPYKKDDWLILKIQQHISKVLLTYNSFHKYFEYVSERLLRQKTYIVDYYGDVNLIKKSEQIEKRWKIESLKSKSIYIKEILLITLGEGTTDVSLLILIKLVNISLNL